MLATCHMINQLCVTMVTVSAQTDKKRGSKGGFDVSECHSYTWTKPHMGPKELQATTGINSYVNRQHTKQQTEMESSYKTQTPNHSGFKRHKPQIIWYYICIFLCVCVHVKSNVINHKRIIHPDELIKIHSRSISLTFPFENISECEFKGTLHCII